MKSFYFSAVLLLSPIVLLLFYEIGRNLKENSKKILSRNYFRIVLKYMLDNIQKKI